MLITLIYAVIGTLKGYDQLMNLVLDDVKELMRGMSSPPSSPFLSSPSTPSSYPPHILLHSLLRLRR